MANGNNNLKQAHTKRLYKQLLRLHESINNSNNGPEPLKYPPADLFLVASDGFVKAHKTQLYICSPLARKIFSGEECCCHRVIIMKEFSLDAVKAFLRYIYTGRAKVDQERKMKELKELCRLWMIEDKDDDDDDDEAVDAKSKFGSNANDFKMPASFDIPDEFIREIKSEKKASSTATDLFGETDDPDLDPRAGDKHDDDKKPAAECSSINSILKSGLSSSSKSSLLNSAQNDLEMKRKRMMNSLRKNDSATKEVWKTSSSSSPSNTSKQNRRQHISRRRRNMMMRRKAKGDVDEESSDDYEDEDELTTESSSSSEGDENEDVINKRRSKRRLKPNVRYIFNDEVSGDEGNKNNNRRAEKVNYKGDEKCREGRKLRVKIGNIPKEYVTDLDYYKKTVLGYEEEKVRPKRRRRLLELSEEDDDDDGGKLMIEDELLEDKQAYRSERQQEKEKPQKLISKFKIPKRRRSSDDVSDEVARIFGTSSYSVPKPVNRKESS